ncbi:MAG: cytidyltransferase [Pelagibacterales bacterium]|jgi:cytidyltransferase-like protein|nr:cytidyltransferase [Pelagibacterales bacterium]|tara:strand:+ start:5355 stop:5774 length:420 start_codon:yes stop_codon:yes gene_type:complete
MKKNAVIVSGYFNPIHKGHIDYLNLAKSRGDILIVIVNNDYQRELKGSKEFMKQDERALIIKNIKCVDNVYISIDKDKTVIKTIRVIHSEMENKFNLFFANGGDQNNSTIAEVDVCNELKIGLIDNLGNKVQSSSWLLK